MIIVHFASPVRVEGLFATFAKPGNVQKGELEWVLPDWLQLMHVVALSLQIKQVEGRYCSG